ncbi:hypothetical protein V8E36_008492 [Tilletia maclaganii]
MPPKKKPAIVASGPSRTGSGSSGVQQQADAAGSLLHGVNARLRSALPSATAPIQLSEEQNQDPVSSNQIWPIVETIAEEYGLSAFFLRRAQADIEEQMLLWNHERKVANEKRITVPPRIWAVEACARQAAYRNQRWMEEAMLKMREEVLDVRAQMRVLEGELEAIREELGDDYERKSGMKEDRDPRNILSKDAKATIRQVVNEIWFNTRNGNYTDRLAMHDIVMRELRRKPSLLGENGNYILNEPRNLGGPEAILAVVTRHTNDLRDEIKIWLWNSAGLENFASKRDLRTLAEWVADKYKLKISYNLIVKLATLRHFAIADNDDRTPLKRKLASGDDDADAEWSSWDENWWSKTEADITKLISMAQKSGTAEARSAQEAFSRYLNEDLKMFGKCNVLAAQRAPATEEALSRRISEAAVHAADDDDAIEQEEDTDAAGGSSRPQLKPKPMPAQASVPSRSVNLPPSTAANETNANGKRRASSFLDSEEEDDDFDEHTLKMLLDSPGDHTLGSATATTSRASRAGGDEAEGETEDESDVFDAAGGKGNKTANNAASTPTSSSVGSAARRPQTVKRGKPKTRVYPATTRTSRPPPFSDPEYGNC